MRTLHIIGSRQPGGAEHFYVRLVRSLHARHTVCAVNPARSSVAEMLRPDITQYHVPMLGAWDVWSRWRIRRILRAWRPDLVQTYLTRATRLTRAPKDIVHVARLGGYYKLKGYRHAHAWVGNTRGICDYLVNNGLPAARVFYIGNFVDEAQPATAEQLRSLRLEWNIPADAWVILSVGRLHPNKGFSDLLDAFARLPAALHERPVFLLIAGDGPLQAMLKAEAGTLGIAARVRWTGWRQDISPVYQCADLFVSAARHEPLGNVILEAWAHNLPVVATRTAGAQELITHEHTGLLTPCAQPEALAQTMLHLLRSDEAGRRALAHAGRGVVHSSYNQSVIVNAYLDLYNRLLGQR